MSASVAYGLAGTLPDGAACYAGRMKKSILVLALAVVLVLVLYIGSAIVSRSIRAKVADMRGTSFIHKLYAEYAVVGNSCQGEDTDGDSYVSCDFRIQTASSTERIVHLQCPTIWKTIIGGTCKESRFVVPGV